MKTYEVENGFIYEVETWGEYGVSKSGVVFAKELFLQQAGADIAIALREPIIEGSQFNGAILDETLAVDIFVNDVFSGQAEVVNGNGSFEFTAIAGKYILSARKSGLGSVDLEVIVGE